MQQRVGVNGFIVKNGKFLLVKRADNDHFLPGYWEIPGGKLEYGEKVEDGIIREVYEETGLRVEPKSLLSAWEYNTLSNPTQYIQLNFLCIPQDDSEVKLSDEHSDFKWITFDELDLYENSPEFKAELIKASNHPQVKELLLKEENRS